MLNYKFIFKFYWLLIKCLNELFLAFNKATLNSSSSDSFVFFDSSNLLYDVNNSFSITRTIYSDKTSSNERYFVTDECIHEDISKHFIFYKPITSFIILIYKI